MAVPAWAWAAFAAFVVAMLALDLFVLHRRAHEVSVKEAAAWSGIWVAMGLGFGVLLWAWQGGATGQAYLAGYLIEKSLSLDNVFVFAVIFASFAIPARYQHRVLMYGIIGALLTRAAFIVAGVALIDTFHVVIYVFGAVLLWAAFRMLRGESHTSPKDSRVLRGMRRILPATDQLHGQRFIIRDKGRLLATPLLLALIVVETTDVIFAIDSIPAVLAVTTDTFVVYTSNVFALLGMRALYFLLAGAAARSRYLQPGLAVILFAVAVKMLLADVYKFPTWASPAFIAAVLAVITALAVRDSRGRLTRPPAERPDQVDAASRSAGRPRVPGSLVVSISRTRPRHASCSDVGFDEARGQVKEEGMSSTLTSNCPLCGLGYPSRALLELHIREDHPRHRQAAGESQQDAGSSTVSKLSAMTAAPQPCPPHSPSVLEAARRGIRTLGKLSRQMTSRMATMFSQQPPAAPTRGDRNARRS